MGCTEMKRNIPKSIVVVIGISMLALLFTHNVLIDKFYFNTFNTNKWIRNENKRILMIDDLLTTHTIKEKEKSSVIKLLGQPTNYENSERKAVYLLGEEPGLSIDHKWLIVEFNDKDICINYKIVED